MKRVLMWAGIGLLVVGVPFALWAVSSAGVSPEQRVADAEPPPPPVIDVVIEERRLSDTLVVRGTVTAVGLIEVGPPELLEIQPVVVDLPLSIGDAVDPGAVVAVISDRPVIAMSMPVPLYRTLSPGTVGQDVARLQAALVDLGYEVEVDGRFGGSTDGAVRQLYEDRGFQAVETGEDVDAALRDAENSVQQASRSLEDARQSGLASTIQRAQADLRQAQESYDRAAARVGVVVPLGELFGVSHLPGVVSSVEASVGATTGETVLSITTSALVVDSAVDTTLASLLIPGLEAVAGDERSWRLQVLSNTGQDDLGRVLVRLSAIDPLPPEMLGRDVRVEAELAGTEGPVLAVPVTAIRSNADCEFVRVVQTDGSATPMCVTPGVSIGGWVEIADGPDELKPGTKVRLG